MPNDAPAKSTRSLSFSWTYWILWAFVLLFIVYPLSMGPVCRICSSLFGSSATGKHAWELVERVYAPITSLGHTFQPVQDFFEWYMALWGFH